LLVTGLVVCGGDERTVPNSVYRRCHLSWQTTILLAAMMLIVAPLFAFAACQDTQTPITAPTLTAVNIDGFGPLDASKVPSQTWAGWLNKAGALCPEIPASLLAAQIHQESSWDPNAQSQTVPGLHTGGAQGLTQFMPATWKSIGQDDAGNGNISPFNPIDAIMAQGRYMCQLVGDIKADPTLAGGDVVAFALAGGDVVAFALAAYNAGPDAVHKYRGIPPYEETQAYVPSITQLAITKYSRHNSAGTATTTGAAGSGGPVNVPVGPAGPLNAAVLAAAEAEAGLPYVYAGGDLIGPSGIDLIDGRGPGFDCSGLVRYAVYQATGGKIILHRVSRDQGTPGPNVTQIPDAQAQPGDLYAGKFDSANGGNPTAWTHIGIVSAVGPGGPTQMFNAPQSSMNLGYADLTRAFYADAPHAYFRMHL